jgi:phage tail-like protein
MAKPLALLRITHADGREEEIPLEESTTTLGRHSSNGVVLADQEVSRQHARLLLETDRITLVDLNSRNGTFVGAARLSPNVSVPLAYGEAFSIGPFTMRVATIAAPAENEPAPEHPLATSETEIAPVQVGVQAFRPSPEPTPVAASPEDILSIDAQLFGLPLDESRYLQYLPPFFQEEDLLGRFLLAFEGIFVPIEQTVDNFDLYLDPVTTPAHFLSQLASWLNLTLDENWPLDKRRTLTAEAAELYRRRGTHWSLCRHLEIYTDLSPEISEPAERPHHFNVLLRVPAGRTVNRATVERIIEANRPANTTYSLDIKALG